MATNKVIVAAARIKRNGVIIEPGQTLDFSDVDREIAKTQIKELYDVGAIEIKDVPEPVKAKPTEPEKKPEPAKSTPAKTEPTPTKAAPAKHAAPTKSAIPAQNPPSVKPEIPNAESTNK